MDKESFWRLIEREHVKARNYCGRLAGNFASGDDLYQDAVIRAYHGFERLRDVGLFKPWFYRIISNTYKSKFRTSWWRRLANRSESIDIDNLLHHNPTGIYEARRRLEYALEALSVDDKVIVTLAELEGWKISEIAELYAVKDGMIKMRLSRARGKMRERLGRMYKDNFEVLKKQGIIAICDVIKPETD